MVIFEPDQGDQAMRVRTFVQTAAILTLAIVAGSVTLTQEIDGHDKEIEFSKRDLQIGDHSDYRAVGMCGHAACHGQSSYYNYLTDQFEVIQPKLRVSSSHVVSTTDP